MKNFFLEYYMGYVRDGSTVSEDTGPVEASKSIKKPKLSNFHDEKADFKSNF